MRARLRFSNFIMLTLSIQDLDSYNVLISYILLKIAPHIKSPYFIRRVCKGWKNLYDTGKMWMMLYKCYFAQSIPKVVTPRRAYNIEFQRVYMEPYKTIISQQALESFFTSGSKELVISTGFLKSFPVGALSKGFRELSSLTSLTLRHCFKLLSLPAGLHTIEPACCACRSLNPPCTPNHP